MPHFRVGLAVELTRLFLDPFHAECINRTLADRMNQQSCRIRDKWTIQFLSAANQGHLGIRSRLLLERHPQLDLPAFPGRYGIQLQHLAGRYGSPTGMSQAWSGFRVILQQKFHAFALQDAKPLFQQQDRFGLSTCQWLT